MFAGGTCLSVYPWSSFCVGGRGNYKYCMQPKPKANPTTVKIPLVPILCTGFSGSKLEVVKVMNMHSDPAVTYYTIIDKTGMTRYFYVLSPSKFVSICVI